MPSWYLNRNDLNMNESPRLQLVSQVLQKLHQENISYCVLRNYDFLLEKREPQKEAEKSVDLCVLKKDRLRFDQVLRAFQFQTRVPQFSRAHTAYFNISTVVPCSFDVQFGGLHWNDMLYLSETDLLSHRIKRDFFYVPSNDDTVVMLLLHSILGKRHFKPEYQLILLQLWPEINLRYVEEKIGAAMGRKRAQRIMEAVAQKEFGRITQYKYRYVLSFLLTPHRIRIFVPLFFRWVKWKKFWQAAPLISIIGPDGAGKSSMVLALEKYLQEQHRQVAVVYTGRGKKQLLPRIIRDAGYYYKQKERRRDLTEQPNIAWRRILYTLYSPVFIFDLGMRYLTLIFPQRRQGRIVITDRYCTDILLMKHIPSWLKRAYISLFPQPSLTFYLYNTPEVLLQRRPQEKRAEFEYQLQMFEQLRSFLPTHSICTADREQTTTELLTTVMQYLYRQ